MKQRPEITERKAATILLNEVGWKQIKLPAAEGVFFLDSFYRTYQDLARRRMHEFFVSTPSVLRGRILLHAATDMDVCV